jgi:hypothetical protein
MVFPSFLTALINQDSLLFMLPDQSGRVWLSSKNLDPFAGNHWKKVIKVIDERGIKPVGKITLYNKSQLAYTVYKKWGDLDDKTLKKIEIGIKRIVSSQLDLSKKSHQMNIKRFLFQEDNSTV